jgi:hypothetical protein
MSEQTKRQRSQFMAWLPTLAGGVIVLFGVGTWWTVGRVYGSAEAQDLIESLSTTGLYLGSAVTGGSASILALMLTLLGITKRAESEFDATVYRSILKITTFAAANLILAIILMLLFVVPVGDYENIPDPWYPMIYKVLFAGITIISAVMVTTISELALTIRHVVSKVTPGDAV